MAATAPLVHREFAAVDEQAPRNWSRALIGGLALILLVGLSAFIVVVCANRPGALVPSSNPNWYPRWLAGPFGGVFPQLTRSGKKLELMFTYGLLGMYLVYMGAIWFAPSLRARWAATAVFLVHVVFFLSPPLSLTDVFNYIDYGRMEVVYHLNPYATTPYYAPHIDQAFVLSNWHELLSPYGPLFTLLTFALVPLGVAGAFWGVKALLALASLGIIFLVWRSAKLLGRDPVRAIVFVGLNPVVLVFGLGGDHNDFITIFFVMLGIYLLLLTRRAMHDGGAAAGDGSDADSRDADGFDEAERLRRPVMPAPVFAVLRERLIGALQWGSRAGEVAGAGGTLVASGATTPSGSGGILGAPARGAGASLLRRQRRAQPGDQLAVGHRLVSWVWPLSPIEIAAGVSLVVAAGIKASAAVLVPVAVCSLRRSPRRIVQLLIGMAITALIVAAVTYAAFGPHLPDLSTQSKLVTNESLPNLFGLLIGLGGETTGLQQVMQVVLVGAIGGACVMAWRRQELMRPAAWSTVALLVTLSWVLPWYILWLLPLGALVRSRALVTSTLIFGLFLLVVWSPIAGGWYRDIGFYPGSTKLGKQHAYEVKLRLDY